MLSRVADSLYWMSRYLERAEHTVRLFDVNMNLMLDRSTTSVEGRWKRVLAALGNPKEAPWANDYQQLAHTLTFDEDQPRSITACIVSARENARQVRDEISTEQWQQLNRIYHALSEMPTSADSERNLSNFLPRIMDGLHLFQGITDTTMSHGEGWQFIQLGRFLERASATATLLDLYHADTFTAPDGNSTGPPHYLEWVGLLRCCTAFEAYCTVYTADLTQERILEFLLLNREFPHSISFSIDALRLALRCIQKGRGSNTSDELSRLAGRLQASLSFGEISEVLERDPGEYLRDIQRQCSKIHELIYSVYIHYSVQAALAL